MPHASKFDIEADAGETTDILDDGIRSVLNFADAYPVKTQAQWNNAMQAYVEGIGHGIPVNISTNPRTTPVWPDNLALAATFDPDLVFEISKELSKEYRALGISTLLGPQIDMAAEPRWYRVFGTFGEDPALLRDMANASVSGHQSTYDDSGNDLGWGTDSVNSMIKHWPNDGPGEGGREAHDNAGMFTVYPGGQFETGLIPFVDGGLNVNSKTGSASAVMPSYSIAWSDDESLGELVGSAYSEYKISLLRSYGFDGLVCTDWNITDVPEEGEFSTGWGVEDLSESERCYKVIMTGCDQIGGLNRVAPILEAYNIGVSEHGEEAMLERFQESARRILKTFFQVGLFENPYVSVANAEEVVGGSAAMAEGYAAQLKSVVMLKNDDNTIKAAEGTEKPTVYVPMVYSDITNSYYGKSPAYASLPVEMKLLEEYFNVVTDTLSEVLTGAEDEEGNPTLAYEDIIRASAEDLASCDYALVFVEEPKNYIGFLLSGGYDPENEEYIPISLQYGPYMADSDSVRTESISGPLVDVEVSTVYGTQHIQEKQNISYYGNSAHVTNGSNLDTIQYVAENMPESAKVIVAINATTTMIVNEFESQVDAILMGYGIDSRAFLDIVTGKAEPSGLLPLQIPKDMETVEAQYEDVPRDMECHVDTNGNTYDFAFGMNWSGVIEDKRTEKYGVPALITPEATPAN